MKKNMMLSVSKCRVIALLVVIVMTSVLTGCAPIKRITREVTGPGGDLKKKVAIAVFETRISIAAEELRDIFEQQLSAKISRACSNTLLEKSDGKTDSELFQKLPLLPNGHIDTFSLASSGRKFGINAVVSGILLDLRIDQKSHGFWWFKGASPVVELMVGVVTIDSETGARIVDDRFTRKINLKDSELASLKAKDINTIVGVLKKPFQRIADDAGEAVCDALNDQAWKGFIISIIKDRVILSSGKNSGLVPGDLLDVYGSGETISGYAGQQFFLPGIKIGEIKITGIYPNRSEAIVVSGSEIKEGCAVKHK